MQMSPLQRYPHDPYGHAEEHLKQPTISFRQRGAMFHVVVLLAVSQTSCGYTANIELCGSRDNCPKCESNDVKITNGIEVGHTFLLGDKYSKPMKATYLVNDGKPNILQMGCYGLGISRILAASLEKLSLEQELRWPTTLAPYKVLIIPPKSGSKEEKILPITIEDLYQKIEEIHGFKEELIIDDRTHMTIGKRFLEARQVGYPFIIAIGAKIT